MTPTVRGADVGDRRALSRVLATAFADDPVFAHLLPPGLPAREKRLRRLFAIDVARSVRLGAAAMTSDGTGGAVWFPPGHAITPAWEQFLLGPMYVFGVLRSRTLPVARVESMLARHHPRERHWYLLYLGATRTGAGTGSALLRERLDRCDADRVPAYLEATDERNRALYRRHGFVDREPLQLPHGGPTMYPMWRDPH